MQEDDSLKGIKKSFASLASKTGFNSKQFKAEFAQEGQTLNIKVNLINISQTAKAMFADNVGKIIKVEIVSEKEEQSSDALFDTTFRATVGHISEK